MSEEYNEEVTDYERFDNEEHYTNQTLLEQLTKVGYSFGCVWQNRNQPVRKLRIQPVGKE